MRVLHVITSLHVGGAETMLVKLLAHPPAGESRADVVSLTGRGPLAEGVEAAGASVHSLGLRGGLGTGASLLAAVPRLAALIRRLRPDVVQTWMYHADLAGALAAPLGGGVGRRPALVWNVRQASLDPALLGRGTFAVAAVCAALSRHLPSRIVVCAERGAAAHAALGYDAARMVVIPNGFDLDLFRPDAALRRETRGALGLADDELVVGHVGRFDRFKDHATLVAAFGGAAERRRPVRARLVLVGRDVVPSNPSLSAALRAAGVRDALLLGPRVNLPRLYAAFDLFVSSSRSEGFPNAVGEAMAAGVPCVVTDAGDSALLVGPTGLVVPPERADLLADALASALGWSAAEREAFGAAARARVAARFDIRGVAASYHALYRELVDEPERRPS